MKAKLIATICLVLIPSIGIALPQDNRRKRHWRQTKKRNAIG
jgi:hypothetical protein